MNPNLPNLLKDKTIRGLVSDLPDRISEYVNQQRPFALQRTQNRNFVDNKQWGVLIPGFNEIMEPIQDEGEVRLTYNIILGMVNLLRAEIVARSPTWTVNAYSGDEIKIEVANVCEQILRQYYFDADRTGLLRLLLDGVLIDGLSYLTADYFPTVGREIRVNPADGSPIHEGRIVPRWVSSYDMLVPDNYPCLQKVPACDEIIRMLAKDAQERFKEALAFHRITTLGGGDSDKLREDKNQAKLTEKDKDNELLVHKIWLLPGRGALPDDGRFPRGLGIVWIEGVNKVVDILEIPFPWAEMDNGAPMYPYVDFHFNTRLEHFHSQGLPENVIPIQVELNRTISQQAEAKNYAGNLYWVGALGQVQSIDEFPTTNGGVLIHKPLPNVPPPHIEQPPSMPSYIQQMPAAYEQMANKVHSISDIAYAQQPGSTNSQGAQEQMLGQQAKVFMPFIQRYGAGLSLFGTALLMMEQKYTDYQKELRVLDPVGDMSLKRFYSNLDLQGNIDVVVKIDTDPWDPARKKAFALQELQQGGIDKDQYNARVHGEEINSSEKMDSIYAEQENQQFEQGVAVDNRSRIATDIHPVHYKTHLRLKNSDKFNTFSPEIQQALNDHIYIHLFGINAAPQVFQNIVLPRIQQLGIIAAPPPVAPGAQGNPAQGAPPRAQVAG